MKDSKGILLLLVGAIIILAGLNVVTRRSGQSPLQNISTNQNLKKITVAQTDVLVKVADNDATRQKGLGGVESLPQDQGMLFVFDTKQTSPGFWMKDMLIPLDFIWISNGKIVEIDTNVPPPAKGTPDEKLKVYTPIVPIDYVLEVNAGFATNNSVKVGDSVTGI